MFEAYSDNGREIEDSDIILAMENIKPASKGIMNKTVESLQKWAEEQGIKNANSQFRKDETKVLSKAKTGRQIYINNQGGKTE